MYFTAKAQGAKFRENALMLRRILASLRFAVKKN